MDYIKDGQRYRCFQVIVGKDSTVLLPKDGIPVSYENGHTGGFDFVTYLQPITEESE